MRRTRRAAVVSILLAACLAIVGQFSARIAAAPVPATVLANARLALAKALEPASSAVPVLRRLASPVRLAQSSGGAGTAPWVTTDKSDYKPGETVQITGGGFAGDISVFLQVVHTDPTSPDTDPENHLPWPVGVNPDGTFSSTWYVEPSDSEGQEYLLTATGSPSNVTAETRFTDNASANLDQCANDSSPSPSNDGCNVAGQNPPQWENGNLGASKAVYFEGDSIPYRLRFDALTLASHTVTIEWDTTKSSKHAIDYLTTFNRTVTTADACLDVTSCPAAVSTFAIPADTQVTGGGVTPIAGNFTLYGGTITSVSAYSYPNGTGFIGDTSAQITITFTASAANPVLAWGGHIATRHDWGADNSAVAIKGSPYHTSLDNLDGSGGRQDRSLSEDAVIFPGSITIIKDATPNGSQSFAFTASPSPLSNFNLVDNGTSANTKLFSNITDFQKYTIDETPIPTNWKFDSVSCSVTTPDGGSYTANTTTVEITMKEGEDWTCTYLNSFQKGTPTVTTEIHNNDGDVALSSTAVDLGTTVHDKATVTGTGSLGTPTGNVNFTFYTTSTTCTGTSESAGSLVALVSGVAHPSDNKGPLAAGSYSFKAHYNGDDHYFDADSDCEALTVNRGTSGQYLFTTDIHNTSHQVVTSVPLGATVHDKATLSSASFTPTGKVSFTFYNNGTCANTAAATSSKFDLSSGAFDATTFTQGPLAAGSYSFRAHYDGDSNFEASDAVCEPLTVEQGTLTLSTTMHQAPHVVVTNGGHVALGTVMHDNATLSGANANFTPTGAITFTFSGGALGANAATEAGFYATSASTGAITVAGSYSFTAAYAGDSNYKAIAAGTHDPETFVVDKGTTTTTTALHNGATDSGTPSVLGLNGNATGSAVHDSAAVSGQVGSTAITGSVAFRFYTTQAACTGDTTFGVGISKGTVSLVNGVADPSTAATGLTAGNYAFRAKYYGDANYAASLSDCEPFFVSTITIIKNAKPAQGNFAFTTTGTGYNAFNLTGATTNDGNKNTQFLAPAVSGTIYTAKEGTQLGWLLDAIGGNDPNNPTACAVSGSGNGSSGTGDVNTQTATITLKPGDGVTCTFENTGNGATRTQGFWATHPQLALLAWNGGTGYNHTFPGVVNVSGIGDQTVCASLLNYNGTTIGKNINSLARLMGGFWSDISKTSTGSKRSNTDQSRMQLLQQLLAAELNASAFGSVPSSGTFASWESAYCSGNAQALQTAMQQAASFNTQGDSSTFTPGTAADSKNARAVADIPFWNVLP